jgi:uncharacterized damage-inducible protein DinB
MNTEDIRTLYAFNRWANHRSLADARALDSQELTRDLGASYPSVHATLVHILWAEWLWLRRWQGESPKQVFAPAELGDLSAIESRWEEVEREQESFIAQLTDERLVIRIGYENRQGERWEYSLGHMMQHVVNHSSYHRGQVVALLRQLGHLPQATDFLLFFDEGGGTRVR